MFRRKNRCPVKGCKNPGRPIQLACIDVCGMHNEQRAAVARSEWVDPETLETTRYTATYAPLETPSLVGDGSPACGACGHPRWVHAVPGCFWDGPCLVPECVECDGERGHAPGYVPSRRKVLS